MPPQVSTNATQRFDSTIAEATHLLGVINLKVGNVELACEQLFEALDLVTQAEGTEGLLTAEILEDLALAQTRKRPSPLSTAAVSRIDEGSEDRTLGASLLALMVPATEAAGVAAGKLRKLRDREGGISDVEAIDAMVTSALSMRRRKNGRSHLRVAHCLLRRTELFWTEGRYEEIVALYAEASPIFEAAAGTANCKPVAQLAAWTATAHLYNRDFKKAEESSKTAEELATKVFGAESWEFYRTMMDKVRLYQSVADDAKQQGVDPALSDVARKAFMKAERIEVQAKLLQAALLKAGSRDEVLQTLSFYAPQVRAASHSGDVPAMTEGTTSKARSSIATAKDSSRSSKAERNSTSSASRNSASKRNSSKK